MSGEGARLCPENGISDLLAVLQADQARGLQELDILLGDYPQDPRLHFLKGSMLAAQQDYSEARLALRRAVDLAPNYDLARFQLGFLLLTSGDAFGAQEAWGPLHGLAKNNYLRLFVEGLCHLIRDEFDDTIRLLEEGIAANGENAPMNRDMQLIIGTVKERAAAGDTAPSAVDLLLQQAAFKNTRH